MVRLRLTTTTNQRLEENYGINKKQESAIKSFENSLKRIEKAGLKLMMQSGSCQVYQLKDYENMAEFDHGWAGMTMSDGTTVEPIDSFDGIDH